MSPIARGKMDEKELNSTVSTKFSTDQLICKSPPSSVDTSDNEGGKEKRVANSEQTPIALYLGILQILFGMLMGCFGVMVLVHNSNLSQIGGGLWGGCLAALTGVMGVFSVARDCCPLKTHFQRVAHTAFLALSLVSLAVAHLVLVIACIGISRDTSSNEFQEEQREDELPSSLTLFSNAGLLVVSACECVAAAMSAYQSSRALCPCFRPTSGAQREAREPHYAQADNKNMLVSSWLGKQGQQAVYVVQKGKGMPKLMAPIFTVSPPSSVMPPSLMGYPLIPAPLGATPPPILNGSRPHHRERIHRKRKRFPNDRQVQRMTPHEDKTPITKPKSKKREKKKNTITTEEVAKTYTGLDRVIAEEFIEICDSNRHSSDSSGCVSSDNTSNPELSK